MYRPPNSGPSHGRSPSVDGDFSRAPQRSLNLSYAYGAPASPRNTASTATRQRTSPGESRSAASGSGSVRTEDRQEEEGTADTGRAEEPASVRYGRLAQRKKDTGAPYPQQQQKQKQALPMPGNTTSQIATAFHLAMHGEGTLKTGGRREDFPPLKGAGRVQEEQEDGEDEVEQSGKESGAPPSTGKKRKKHAPRDLTFRHREGDTTTSEESEYDQSHGKQKKRAKHGSEGDDLADDPAAANKPRRRSRKPADTAYNPRQDPNYHAGQTSTSESDEDEAKTHRRRKSKGKGRGIVGGSSAASRAIPRGVLDGEIWMAGKKRKSKKGSRKSAANGGAEEEEGEGEGGEEEVEDVEGRQENDGDDSFQNGDDPSFEEGDVTPPAASFFLRPKSPNQPRRTPSVSPQPAQDDWRSPFRFGGKDGATPVDPAFSAFDRSLGGAGGENSNSLSLEDSAIRGSSYDFSEEEAIVRILEEKSALQQNNRLKPSPLAPSHQTRQLQEEEARHQQHGATPGSSQQRNAALAATPNLQHLRQQQQQQQSPAGASPSPSVAATPVPYTGAYPQTPGQVRNVAWLDSPVSAFRRRAGQGVPVPSMLGAGTTLAPPLDEEDEAVRHERLGGKIGEKVGWVLRPFIDLVLRAWQKTQDPLLDWGKIGRAVLVVALGLFALLAFLAPSTTEPPVPAGVPPASRSTFFDYVPYLRSSPLPSPYVPPNIPADSLEGLIARLTHLETAVGRISSASDSDRQQRSHDQQTTLALSTQLDMLQATLAAELERARSALSQAEQTSATEATAVGKAVASVKGDLESLVSRVKSLSEDREVDSSELKKVQSSIDVVGKDLVALNSQVVKVAKDLEAATDFDRITKIALDAVAKKLPGKMAARIDDSGRLEIDPVFWRVLKDAFADKKGTDAKIAALQSPKGGLFGSPKEAKPSAPVIAAPPTWDDFLVANEDSLKAWVASDLSSRSGSDAFVSKQQFLDLLRREVKTLKREFEFKVNENFESMGQELLNKVARQEELKKKDSIASHLNPFHRHQHAASSSPGSPVVLKSADGQNVTAIISSLVDSALLRYSKDVLARPDYALYTSGGRVIRSLTSETYEPHPASVMRSALAWITGTNAPRGRPPVTALHPDTSPGSCWPFAGQHGQIGVQLSRRVVPSDITIEHISSDVALDGDVSSAPKDFEVWGVVEGQEDIVKLVHYRQQQLEAKRAARESGTAPSLEDDLAALENEPASLPLSANHLLLASGSYDPSATSPVQTFPVTQTARELGLPVNVVVVKILTNHGESAYTCLYRVRVSGITESQTIDSPPVNP